MFRNTEEHLYFNTTTACLIGAMVAAGAGYASIQKAALTAGFLVMAAICVYGGLTARGESDA